MLAFTLYLAGWFAGQVTAYVAVCNHLERTWHREHAERRAADLKHDPPRAPDMPDVYFAHHRRPGRFARHRPADVRGGVVDWHPCPTCTVNQAMGRVSPHRRWHEGRW